MKTNEATMKTFFSLVVLLVWITPFPGNSRSLAQQKSLNVVTTLNYLRAICQEIGGDHVEAVALANPKQDPHYVTPTPRMNQLASKADLFIENGLSLDIWAKNVVDASGNPGIQPGSRGHLVATINVPVQELPTEISRAWGDIHPQGNPHVWLDPFNVKIIAANIAGALQALDEGNAASYQQRLEAFKNRLDGAMFGEELLKAIGPSAGDILTRKAKNADLISWLKSKKLDGKLGGWMKQAQQLQGVKVISYHKTYIYFAERFGLKIMSELEEKPGIPPPPRHRDEIIDLVKREGIKVILNDNYYSSDAAEYVASKTNAKVLITYIDVGSAEEATDYRSLISYLLEEILQATR
jgi:zinc/manganese transport system substrate-binding protein